MQAAFDPALRELPTPTHPTEDPLGAYENFAFRRTFYPLGFPLGIETNDPALLTIAAESWPLPMATGSAPMLRLRIGVRTTSQSDCPPLPIVRAYGHQLSIVADTENFLVCDLREGTSFGWVGSAALLHPSYLRYCLLDAAIMTLVGAVHVSPVHAACISYAGCGMLLHGRSGAGKSTLAYACARERGWTYTSDDCSYLVRHEEDLRVRGNSHQLRFRPGARQLFPELQDRSLTPRIEGKPSMEVLTAELPNIVTASDAPVHVFIALKRHNGPGIELTPLSEEAAIPPIEECLFPLPLIRELQLPAIQRVLRAKLYTLHYRDLAPAIERLRQLAVGE